MPKPSALKLLEGTYRADRVAPNEPHPTLGLLVAPEWLPEDAREEWERSAPELHRTGVSAVVDYASFLGYCLSYARAMAAEDDAAIYGNILETSWGRQKNPAVSIAQTEWAAVRKFAADFGLNPASRTRVSGKATGSEKPQSLKDRLRGNARSV